MRYRTFGRTGLNVSTVSMGSNRLGDPGVDPTAWPPVVECALRLGVNFFDTSISYNQGRSEAILGDVTSRRTVQQLEANLPAADADLSAAELGRVHELHAEWRTEGRW